MPVHSSRCFVVADGGHARFLRPAADHGLHTFETLESSAVHKQTSDLVSDRMGRSFESGSPTRHGYTPRTDPHELAKEKFAHGVGHRINALSAEGAFDDLVVVAPPHAMNEILDALDTVTAGKIVGRLAKDLTKVPEHDLSPHLTEWVRPVHRAGPPRP